MLGHALAIVCLFSALFFFAGVFFFFQAEDGIRDLTVTGVQTCALPISWELGVAIAAPDSPPRPHAPPRGTWIDRKSTRLNSSHSQISYAVFCLKKKKKKTDKASKAVSTHKVNSITKDGEL